MTTYLFIVQIGPVQSYIASARKVRDLIVGSYTLSALARAGIEHVQDSAKLIVPSKPPQKDIHNGIPHRFIFTADVTADVAATYLNDVEQAIRDQWKQYTDAVMTYLIANGLPIGDWQDDYQQQVQTWLNFYGVAVEMTDDYPKAIERANQAMASRKQSRTFVQLDDADRPKCPITGEGAVLDLDWRQLNTQFSESIISEYSTGRYEAMGAMALFKRFASHAKLDYLPKGINKIPDTDTISGYRDDDQRSRDAENYFAVLHMDGDKMGERVKEIKDSEAHRAFSQKLLSFATEHVQPIVESYDRAVLVYAGGDDVLALLPLESALDCAKELRSKFGEVVGGTASAGIAIGHYKYPLDRVLNASRAAEKVAKDIYGRDAITITETTSGGQTRKTGGKWRQDDYYQPLLETMSQVQKAFTKKEKGGDGLLSGSLAYDMRDIEIALGGDDMRDARKEEFHRLLKRRTLDTSQASRVQELGEHLIQLAEETTMGWGGLSNWLILARFLSQTVTSPQTESDAS
jgi:CRISPR-associated protein Cmr2